MQSANPLILITLIAFLALTGSAIGSFAGVVSSRGIAASLGGRSHCVGCHRTLRWFELVPFVSYVALRGRCRTCGSVIGVSAFLWELGGGCAVLAAVLLLVRSSG